jgi:hypothetical protein
MTKVVLVIAHLLFSEDRKSGCLSIALGPNNFGHGPGGTRLVLLDIYIQRECENPELVVSSANVHVI